MEAEDPDSVMYFAWLFLGCIRPWQMAMMGKHVEGETISQSRKLEPDEVPIISSKDMLPESTHRTLLVKSITPQNPHPGNQAANTTCKPLGSNCGQTIAGI